MLLSLILLVGVVTAASTAQNTAPTVKLDQGTLVGTTDGVNNKFYGIPFAQPPVGNLRFQLPVALAPYKGTVNATNFGPTCTQLSGTIDVSLTTLPNETLAYLEDFTALTTPSIDSEDCLTLNVVVPAGTKPNAKLPVAVWIYGGGFETGGSSTYDGTVITNRSTELGEPIIYVSFNYRLSAFGFLASEEVKKAGLGNIGLHDQRFALRWINKYISAFGGDPSKVTIWGESAGSTSVALQMLTNDGDTEGLFRAAFMESGSAPPMGDITNGQIYYDALVAETGCSGSRDTLQCLREVPYANLTAAVNLSPALFAYQSLRLAWFPRVDGVFLKEDPRKLVLRGSIAKIPFVNGDCDDEGTLFSLSSSNITTEDELRTYWATNYFSGVSDADMDTLLKLYPDNPAGGSPFDTGTANEFSPEFKRSAAMLGDYFFQSARRAFLQQRSSKQPTWSFLSKRSKDIPVLGSAHGTDLLILYDGGDITDYLINFVNNLNPNGKTVPEWPQYSTQEPKLLELLDGTPATAITSDDFRVAGMELLAKLSLKFPL